MKRGRQGWQIQALDRSGQGKTFESEIAAKGLGGRDGVLTQYGATQHLVLPVEGKQQTPRPAVTAEPVEGSELGKVLVVLLQQSEAEGAMVTIGSVGTGSKLFVLVNSKI